MTTDRDIIRASLEDPGRFGELFERHAHDIGRFAARRVGVAAAEDVLSETFLVAFRRRGAFDQAWESARPWLFGIASRLIRKHRGDEAANWRSFQAAAGSAHASSDGGFAAADERTDAAASVRALVPLIAALSRADRDTLLLYAWGDLTYEEVGRALGVPTGTVRSRLNRARRRLAASRVARSGAPLELEEEVG